MILSCIVSCCFTSLYLDTKCTEYVFAFPWIHFSTPLWSLQSDGSHLWDFFLTPQTPELKCCRATTSCYSMQKKKKENNTWEMVKGKFASL